MSGWFLKNQNLKLFEPELLDKTQKRFEEIKNTHPIPKGFDRQKSYVKNNPIYRLVSNAHRSSQSL